MTRRFEVFARPFLGLLLLVPLAGSAGCDPYEPTRLPLGDTVTLHSLARPEYIGEYSAFDFAAPRAVVVEQPKGLSYADFDVAFSEEDGQPVLLPAGMFESFDIAPGVRRDSTGAVFEGLTRAPSDGYITDAPIVLEEGPVYIVKTRRQGACSQYAKFEVLDLDPAGILEFRFLRNNLCNDRDLTDVDDSDG